MKLTDRKFAVEIPYPEIIELCRRWQVKRFYLFGSVLRDDFHADSDIDVMVEFFDNAAFKIGWNIVTMNDELEEIFQRKVDLLTKKGIENSENWIRKENILSSVTLIYEQAE